MKIFQEFVLKEISWQEFSYKPLVKCAVKEESEKLIFSFIITEKDPRATYSNFGNPVYKDSCIEIFLSEQANSNYLNFEFNRKGAMLVEYGTEINRSLLKTEERAKIHVNRSIALEQIEKNLFQWGIEIELEKNLLIKYFPSLKTLDKLELNIHKCGDETIEPHYISLFFVNSEKPNFHIRKSLKSIKGVLHG